jgi:hypothetical protein
MKFFSSLLLFFIFVSIQICPQVTINIPGDYPTIQAGIDAADSGNVVLVAEGTYYENINYNGKAITVASHFFVDGNKSHIGNTIIDGSLPTNPDYGSVVYFMSGEDSTSVLCGFTVTGGTGTRTGSFWSGGGIFIASSSPMIKNNIIQNNTVQGADYVGGSGLKAIGPYPTTLIIESNSFKNNLAQTSSNSSQCTGTIELSPFSDDIILFRNNSIYNNVLTGDYDLFGGGLYCWGSNTPSCVIYVENNIIVGNEVTDSPGSSTQWGGGIYLQDIKAYVRNNIVAYNSAEDGGGLYYFNNINPPPVYPTLENNTFYGNTATVYGGAFNTNRPYDIVNCVVWGNSSPQFYGGAATIEYSNVEESYTGTGNISQDPEFLDTTDYFLLSTASPCIDSGNPDPMYNDIEDPNNLGFALYPAQGTLLNDIGHFGGPHSNWADVLSDTLHVPADHSTIQAAIDAANNGDVVLVADGLYSENINYKGKAITVASHFFVDNDLTHIENTIIDGSQPSHPDTASVVFFMNGEDTTSVLCGFTITGGTGTYHSSYDVRGAGGINVFESGAKICNNIVEYNSVTDSFAYGGGIMVYSPGGDITIIENNKIRNNSLEGTYPLGGGISLFNNGVTFVYFNQIIDNAAIGTYASGGGIDVAYANGETVINTNFIKNNDTQINGYGGGGIDLYGWDALITVSNNLIVDNNARWGGGVLVDYDIEGPSKTTTLTESTNYLQEIPVIINNTIINNFGNVGGGIHSRGSVPAVINSIVWGNTFTSGGQIFGAATVTYSDVEGGWTGPGNMNEDPNFDDSTYFCLNYRSNCVDAGNPDPLYNDVEDPINLGYALLPARGTLINDMGHFGGPNSLWSLWDSIVISVEYDIIDNGIPNEFTLLQNYPNPFNPTTIIKYGVSERTFVELRIYDILGREVELMVNKEQDAGYYELNFNASNLASGIYLYQLKAGNFIESKKMLLLK